MIKNKWTYLVCSLLLVAMSCTSENKTADSKAAVSNEEVISAETEKDDQVTVSGVITKIEHGKDGYMATLKTDDGQEYVATISIPNLSGSGSTYKAHEVKDTILVTGPIWQDGQGGKHITVKELK